VSATPVAGNPADSHGLSHAVARWLAAWSFALVDELSPAAPRDGR